MRETKEEQLIILYVAENYKVYFHHFLILVNDSVSKMNKKNVGSVGKQRLQTARGQIPLYIKTTRGTNLMQQL